MWIAAERCLKHPIEKQVYYNPIHTTGKTVGLYIRKKSIDSCYLLGVDWMAEYGVER